MSRGGRDFSPNTSVRSKSRNGDESAIGDSNEKEKNINTNDKIGFTQGEDNKLMEFIEIKENELSP